MDSKRLLERAASAGMRRGARGSNVWLAVGVFASAMRLLRWLARPQPDTVYRAVLEPGESLEISTHPPKR